MIHVNFIGAKGGVGTTTLALFTAQHLQCRVTARCTRHLQLFDAANVPVPEDPTVHHIDFGAADFEIFDCPPDHFIVPTLRTDHYIRNILVVRNDYLSMRQAIRQPSTIHGVIAVLEPGRAIDVNDIEMTVPAPIITTVPHDTGVARVMDAGITSSRTPKALQRPLAAITDWITP